MADFGCALRWRAQGVGFLTRKAQVLHKLHIKYYSCSISHMVDIYQYGSAKPERGSCEFKRRERERGKKANSLISLFKGAPPPSCRQQIIIFTFQFHPLVRLKTCNCASSVCVKSGCRSLRGGLRRKAAPHVEERLGIFPPQSVKSGWRCAVPRASLGLFGKRIVYLWSFYCLLFVALYSFGVGKKRSANFLQVFTQKFFSRLNLKSICF